MTSYLGTFGWDESVRPVGWVPGLESLAPFAPRDASLHWFLLGEYARTPDYYVRAARLAGGTVLDLGCGDGRLTLRLARDGLAVVGLDRNAEMLNRLRSRREQLPWSTRWRIATTRADLAQTQTLARHGSFSSIVMAGAMVGAVPPTERRTFFDGLRQATEPGGHLIFDFCEHDRIGIQLAPRRRFNLSVDRRNGLSALVTVTQTFSDGTEQIIYESSDLLADGQISRDVTSTTKYLVNPEDIVADLASAGWRIQSREAQDVGGGVTSHFLVCSPRK